MIRLGVVRDLVLSARFCSTTRYGDDDSTSVPQARHVRTPVAAVRREAGVKLDVRRFRLNVAIDTDEAEAFGERGWAGGIVIGAPSVAWR